MKCPDIQTELLDRDWTLRDLELARRWLTHIEQCETCRAAVNDHDKLRSVLQKAGESGHGLPAAMPDIESDPPEGGWTAFADRLESAVDAADHRPVLHRIGPGFTLSLAAMFVLAVTGWWIALGLGGAHIAHNDADSPEANAQFMPQQVNQQVEVFRQVSEVFEDRAGWVAQSDSQSEMGVSASPIAHSRSILALRLTMLQSGRVISQSDLLIVPGQAANLTLPLSAEHQLLYRVETEAGTPTRLVLSAELRGPHGDDPLGVIATHLRAAPGEVVPAGQLVTSIGDFELKVGFSEAPLPDGG